jgi:hypothetical protein
MALGSDGLTCKVETGRALVEAGLHPAIGGDGLCVCSGDMLLEAPIARPASPCGCHRARHRITRRALSAEGDLDFRGTGRRQQRGTGGLS